MPKVKPRTTDGTDNCSPLGLTNPEKELVKARLTLQIYRLIEQRVLRRVGINGVGENSRIEHASTISGQWTNYLGILS